MVTAAFRSLVVIVLISVFTVIGLSQTKKEQIDAFMHKLAERGQFNGGVLVSEHGKVIYENGFGYAGEKTDLKFSPDSRVYLASLSKQFTAMAIMMLQERNDLSYDDPVTKYLLEFPSYGQKITIRNLLNHTSGVPDYPAFGIERPGLTNEEVFAVLLKSSSPRFAPGEKFEYSNSGYVLLAMIVEKISGDSFRSFLEKNIFNTLGMKDSFVRDKTSSLPEKRARGYSRFGDSDDYTILTYGEGGIYSTVRDLYKWDQALYTEKLVKQETLKQAFAPAKLNDGKPTNYGFGWGLGTNNGEPTVSHAGRFGGFNTYIKRFTTSRNSIIFLTNHGFKNMGAIGNALINILNNQPYQLPKLPVADVLFKNYRSEGKYSSEQLYASLKASNSHSYDFGIAELDELGYRLLRTNETAKAIEVFRLNVEAYPSVAEIYDSLGEAYMKTGDRDLAIKNYKKSLELNPANVNAAAMLKKLGSN